MPAPTHNVFIIGPMGAGKTTIGRRVADALGFDFIDTDEALENRTGAEVALIFDIEGEEGFRRREHTMLAEVAERDGVVVATGGGSVIRPENRSILRARGTVVYLHASVEQQLRRLRRDKRRPLLQHGDRRQRLERINREREPLYRDLADVVVNSGGGIGRMTRRVLKALEAYREQRSDRRPERAD